MPEQGWVSPKLPRDDSPPIALDASLPEAWDQASLLGDPRPHALFLFLRAFCSWFLKFCVPSRRFCGGYWSLLLRVLRSTLSLGFEGAPLKSQHWVPSSAHCAIPVARGCNPLLTLAPKRGVTSIQDPAACPATLSPWGVLRAGTDYQDHQRWVS